MQIYLKKFDLFEIPSKGDMIVDPFDNDFSYIVKNITKINGDIYVSFENHLISGNRTNYSKFKDYLIKLGWNLV